jgi:hypothetical protein
MIRELTISDIQQFIEISKVKLSESEQLSDEMLKYFLTNDKNKTFGYFRDDTLITSVVIRFGELHTEKTWSVVHMFTRNLKQMFSFGEDFGQIISEAFKLAERNGFYKYVYIVNKKHENAYYRMWKTNRYLPPSNRYEIYDLAVVPAGNFAPEDWMTRLMGGPKNYDVVIKQRVLKHEFRNSIDTLKSSEA